MSKENLLGRYIEQEFPGGTVVLPFDCWGDESGETARLFRRYRESIYPGGLVMIVSAYMDYRQMRNHQSAYYDLAEQMRVSKRQCSEDDRESDRRYLELFEKLTDPVFYEKVFEKYGSLLAACQPIPASLEEYDREEYLKLLREFKETHSMDLVELNRCSREIRAAYTHLYDANTVNVETVEEMGVLYLITGMPFEYVQDRVEHEAEHQQKIAEFALKHHLAVKPEIKFSSYPVLMVEDQSRTIPEGEFLDRPYKLGMIGFQSAVGVVNMIEFLGNDRRLFLEYVGANADIGNFSPDDEAAIKATGGTVKSNRSLWRELFGG